MNDMNRLLIFLLLAGLLFALYKYQHIIFSEELKNTIMKNIPGGSSYVSEKPKKITYRSSNREGGNRKSKNEVTLDNISQLSIGSLENENANTGNAVMYKQDSLLGSLCSDGSLGTSLPETEGSEMDNMSGMTNNSSLFF